MPTPLLAALALLTATAAADPPYNWATDTHGPSGDAQFAASKGVCRRLGPPRPPASDVPTPAQRAALKGCDAEKLYYGEGARPDYVRARQCAFTRASQDQVFGGATILMQVYANGLGVAKNLDLATAYACTIDGAPAENDGRVKHLQALKAKPQAGRFDVCDDMTSGAGVGFCTARDSRQAAVGRDAREAALVARLPAAAKPLYAEMKRDLDAFVKARTGEIDQSGTLRGAQAVTAMDVVRDGFLKELTELLTGRLRPATPAEAQAADAALNAAYRKQLASVGGPDSGTVKPQDVREAQRAWLRWRDAYVRFARVAAPGVSSDAVLARLSRDRTAGLDGSDDPDNPDRPHPYDPDRPR